MACAVHKERETTDWGEMGGGKLLRTRIFCCFDDIFRVKIKEEENGDLRRREKETKKRMQS
jgi:hypothetical protein